MVDTKPMLKAFAPDDMPPHTPPCSGPTKRAPLTSAGTLIGQVIEGYEVLGLLGEGGWGRVFHVREQRSRRELVLKRLRPELQDTLNEHPNVAKRFEYEVRAAQSVNHPNLIQAMDYKSHSSIGPFIIMEYRKGTTLHTILSQTGPLSIPQLQMCFGQICAGLEALHNNQIIYRDLKPSNVYLVPIYGYELVKLLDFGSALIPHTERISQTGQIVGTPLYMSPEQIISPSQITHRSDIYALGMVFYEALTGTPLFKENNPLKLFQLHNNKNKPFDYRNIPLCIIDALSRILHPDPDQRPDTIQNTWSILESALNEATQSQAPPPMYSLSSTSLNAVEATEHIDTESNCPATLPENQSLYPPD
jgi:serine/threonine-protein kinase